MKEREKGGVNCLKSVKIVIGWYKLQLWMWLVDLDKNFEFDWLIELCDNKLSDNKCLIKSWQVNKWKTGVF